MYACIALLTNNEIQNIGRKMVYDLSVQYGINTISARLPQHISMKQSFQIKDLVEIEGYVEELVSDLSPFEVEIMKRSDDIGNTVPLSQYSSHIFHNLPVFLLSKCKVV